MRKSRLNKNSQREVAKLIKKLDRCLSKLTLERDKNEGCITSGVKTGIFHAGHFRRRSLMSTRFHPQNVNKQSARDNTFLYGREYEYGLALDRKFGEGTARKLYELSRKTRQWTADELRVLISACEKGHLVYSEIYSKLR